jgi:hypothetical protein
MTTFLGVSPSDVCEGDTKPSATDPRIRKHSASHRRIDRGVRAAEGGYEPSLQGLGRRLRPTAGPRFVPRGWGTAVGTPGALVHERQARKAAGDDGSFP